ncbi:MAG: hypothetical protein Q9160_004229 [Pyrenula sp. 1 TL-2023]
MDELEEWYEKCFATKEADSVLYPLSLTSAILTSLDEDVLDPAIAGSRTRHFLERIHVIQGFCAKCRRILQDWPSVDQQSHESLNVRQGLANAHSVIGTKFASGEETSDDAEDLALNSRRPSLPFSGILIEPHHESVYALEAAKGNGCRLCSLFVQALEELHLLNIYRKIEQRLMQLSKPVRLVLTAAYIASRDQYFAGMWWRDIEYQLCWSKVYAEHLPTFYQAPTWSWASVNGRIRYYDMKHFKTDQAISHAIDAVMTLTGGDAFGDVSKGVLRIACSGMVFGGPIWKRTGIDGGTKPYGGEADYGIVIDTGSTYHVIDVFPDFVTDSGFGQWLFYLLPFFIEETQAIPVQHPARWETLFDIAGIVLVQDGDFKGQFRRFGAFSCRYSSDIQHNKDAYVGFCKLLNDMGKIVAESVCAEVIDNAEHPDERYVIAIV